MEATPKAGSFRIARVMRGNRSRDTKPELAVRRMLHRNGLRYRVNTRPIPAVRRTADIVFTTKRVAIFVDGCFWHGCPDHYVPAKSNRRYWDAKIASNRMRDLETSAILASTGWTVLRFWAHENPEDVVERIRSRLLTIP